MWEEIEGILKLNGASFIHALNLSYLDEDEPVLLYTVGIMVVMYGSHTIINSFFEKQSLTTRIFKNVIVASS